MSRDLPLTSEWIPYEGDPLQRFPVYHQNFSWNYHHFEGIPIQFPMGVLKLLIKFFSILGKSDMHSNDILKISSQIVFNFLRLLMVSLRLPLWILIDLEGCPFIYSKETINILFGFWEKCIYFDKSNYSETNKTKAARVGGYRSKRIRRFLSGGFGFLCCYFVFGVLIMFLLIFWMLQC